MSIVLFIFAALLYAIGGLWMKYSEGLTRLGPTLAIFICFCSGAACQAIGMKHRELGPAYTLVLGLEAIAAVAVGGWMLGERVNAGKILAMMIILLGIGLLERS